jgi:hypothetical protein
MPRGEKTSWPCWPPPRAGPSTRTPSPTCPRAFATTRMWRSWCERSAEWAPSARSILPLSLPSTHPPGPRATRRRSARPNSGCAPLWRAPATATRSARWSLPKRTGATSRRRRAARSWGTGPRGSGSCSGGISLASRRSWISCTCSATSSRRRGPWRPSPRSVGRCTWDGPRRAGKARWPGCSKTCVAPKDVGVRCRPRKSRRLPRTTRGRCSPEVWGTWSTTASGWTTRVIVARGCR